MAVVELEQVTKRYRGHTAVEDFTFSVPEASVFGFIGPNGSGKTTSLRIILRIIEPDSGWVRVLGKDRGAVANDAIGYLPEERGLYRKMTVLRQLEYFGVLKGMSGRAARRSAMDWLERLGLGPWHGKKLETLSKGMSQKVQFIAAAISRPRLLILDEPFSGLDPVNLEILRDAILELRRSGTTLLFSTHDMGTAEKLCDHLCMIYKGHKVLDGSIRGIQAQYGQDTVRIGFQQPVRLREGDLPGTRELRDCGRFYEMRHAGDPHAVLLAALAHGKVDHFEVVHPSLHDIFIRIARPPADELAALSTGRTDA